MSHFLQEADEQLYKVDIISRFPDLCPVGSFIELTTIKLSGQNINILLRPD